MARPKVYRNGMDGTDTGSGQAAAILEKPKPRLARASCTDGMRELAETFAVALRRLLLPEPHTTRFRPRRWAVITQQGARDGWGRKARWSLVFDVVGQLVKTR